MCRTHCNARYFCISPLRRRGRQAPRDFLVVIKNRMMHHHERSRLRICEQIVKRKIVDRRRVRSPVPITSGKRIYYIYL